MTGAWPDPLSLYGELMPASFLEPIDWTAPWLGPYLDTGRPIAESPDWRAALNRAAQQGQLVNFQGRPIQFVPQESLPDGEPYEAHIGRTGCVPTRENLHDFFNALVWLTFPQTKARLNELQLNQLQSELEVQPAGSSYRVGNRRGALRDAATIFDENSALLIALDGEVPDALVARHWSEVFLERRDDFGRLYDVLLFGHALMEKLVKPYASITAHCFPLIGRDLPIPCSTAGARAQLDQLARSLLSPTTSTSSFFPVPVLGFPGWHEGQDEMFYANEDVFRVVKRKKASG